MSDSRTMILQMLSEGKITVEESERLLNALNKEDEVRNSNKAENKNTNQSPNINVFPNIPFLEATKLGINIRDIAQTLHQTVQQRIKRKNERIWFLDGRRCGNNGSRTDQSQQSTC